MSGRLPDLGRQQTDGVSLANEGIGERVKAFRAMQVNIALGIDLTGLGVLERLHGFTGHGGSPRHRPRQAGPLAHPR